jgi:phospholipase C
MLSTSRSTLALAVAVLGLSACNAGGGYASAPGLPTVNPARAPIHDVRRQASGKITHVVIIMQENRSFNDLFYGFPHAKWASYGLDSYNQKITLRPVDIATPWDIDHSLGAFLAACNGTGTLPGTDCRMNGFNNEYVGCGSSCPVKWPQYGYVPHAETKPYFDMAHQYVLADQMYASNLDASSFISHQYIIAAHAGNDNALDAVNYPYSSWGCPGGPSDKIYTINQQRQYGPTEVVCWDPTTLGDELDKKGISWAFYAASYSSSPWIWSAYQAISHIYHGQDWNKDVIGNPAQFITDVANGNMRSVSWVTPTWGNSDHAGNDSNTGPSWVTSVVNAVGKSQYWDSTAIFIFWDDYGGWYDPEPPALKDYDGLGMRLPMIIISPYAKKDHVTHQHLEHGSILKFIEDQFGLPRMAAADKRANSPSDSFNFNQAPRAFVPFQAPYSRFYFLHQPPDRHIPDAE